MDKINVIFVDVDFPKYADWKKSVEDKCQKIEAIYLHHILAKNKSDCSYIKEFKSLITHKKSIIFYHAGNCGEDISVIVDNVPNDYPVVLFTGSLLTNDIKVKFNDYKIKHFIDGNRVIHDRSCPWFFKDFFDDWIERDGPGGNAPNFDILEKGSRQVAIDTLHKLREEILTPLTALHLLLQTDTTSDEIEKIFKDAVGNKIDISDHISKSKNTLNALQETISLNNIPIANRLPQFPDDDLLRIKKHINSETKANTLLNSLCKELDNLETIYNTFNLNQNNKENRENLTQKIYDFATAFENLILHVEEKAIA